MNKRMIGVGLLALLLDTRAMGQEPAQKSGQGETANNNATAPAKAEGMKCCEGMDKMGEMKAGMPMKGEMTGDMNAKMEMMKEMKAKMAEKMKERGADRANPQGSGPAVEKNPPAKDAHQH